MKTCRLNDRYSFVGHIWHWNLQFEHLCPDLVQDLTHSIGVVAEGSRHLLVGCGLGTTSIWRLAVRDQHGTLLVVEFQREPLSGRISRTLNLVGVFSNTDPNSNLPCGRFAYDEDIKVPISRRESLSGWDSGHTCGTADFKGAMAQLARALDKDSVACSQQAPCNPWNAFVWDRCITEPYFAFGASTELGGFTIGQSHHISSMRGRIGDYRSHGGTAIPHGPMLAGALVSEKWQGCHSPQESVTVMLALRPALLGLNTDRGGTMRDFRIADEIAKLADLKQRGLLTDDDFKEQRRRILSSTQGKRKGRVAGMAFTTVAVTALLLGGTAFVVRIVTRSNTSTITSAHASLGTGSVAARTANEISITSLPPAGGKGGDPGDDYPWKNLPQDSRLDPWREYVRECTSFVAWALHSRNGFEMPFYADASAWGPMARARGFVVNTTPTPGSVAWETPGDHVAWVSAVSGSSITIEEYNEHFNGTYDKRTLSSRGKFEFIHFKDLPNDSTPAPTKPSTPPAPSAVAAPQPSTSSGSDRSTPATSGNPEASPSSGGSNSAGSSSSASSGSSPQSASSSPGSPTPSPSPSPPSPTPTPTATPIPSPTPTLAPTPTPTPVTYAEKVGGVSHTWTNYANAGGSEGPSIAAYQTVQIACKMTGFAVTDGNTWWYRIAQSPWNNQYYVSADAFYNNGATSGSLHGTPFVDSAVPNC